MNVDGIALDLFAGSGTLAQAIMDHNLTDGGTRRYILVQLPEPLSIEEKDQKAAAKYCDKLGKPRTIAELTKERLRRAGKKIREENPLFAGDLGFRVFKLASSNIRAWEPARNGYEVINGNRLKTMKLAIQGLDDPETNFGITAKTVRLGVLDFLGHTLP